MKSLKIMSIVAIIVGVAIFSCSKQDMNPPKTKAIMITKEYRTFDENTCDQKNERSNLRTTNRPDLKQVQQFVQVARIIGRNLKSPVQVDVEYNEKTNTFKMKKMYVPEQFVLPTGYSPGNETVTVHCGGGTHNGNISTCNDTDCVDDAIDDCVGGGGCAALCITRIITIVYFPEVIL